MIVRERFLAGMTLLLLWSVAGHAQDSGYTEEETQQIKAMLWRQKEIEKEQDRKKAEAEAKKREAESKKEDTVTLTSGNGTLKKEGEGWVLEFDNEAPAAATAGKEGETESPPSASAGEASGVELIVGGQGKDGIAKTRDLPVMK